MIVDQVFLINNSNIINEDAKESDIITEKEVIYWWKSSKLDTNSITAKLNLTKHFVSRKYKTTKFLLKRMLEKTSWKETTRKQ